MALAWIVDEHEVLSGGAVGLIPLAIGVGFLIDYNLQKRDLSRFGPGGRAGRITGLRLLFGERFDKISPWRQTRLSRSRGS